VCKEELFNLHHAQLWNVIECIFGVVKRQWKIVWEVCEYTLHTQSLLPSAVAVLHNFVLFYDPLPKCHQLPEVWELLVPDPHGDSMPTTGISPQETDHASCLHNQIAEAMWTDYLAELDRHGHTVNQSNQQISHCKVCTVKTINSDRLVSDYSEWGVWQLKRLYHKQEGKKDSLCSITTFQIQPISSINQKVWAAFSSSFVESKLRYSQATSPLPWNTQQAFERELGERPSSAQTISKAFFFLMGESVEGGSRNSPVLSPSVSAANVEDMLVRAWAPAEVWTCFWAGVGPAAWHFCKAEALLTE